VAQEVATDVTHVEAVVLRCDMQGGSSLSGLRCGTGRPTAWNGVGICQPGESEGRAVARAEKVACRRYVEIERC
jgi:hypothetical protein